MEDAIVVDAFLSGLSVVHIWRHTQVRFTFKCVLVDTADIVRCTSKRAGFP